MSRDYSRPAVAVWAEACTVDDCEGKLYARAMCATHYHRWYRTGEALPRARPGDVIKARENATGVRACMTCGESKPLTEYAISPPSRNGRLPHCPPCHAQLEAERYRKRRAKDAHNRQSGVWRDRYLRRTYGITATEFDQIAATQGNRCAVCQRDQSLVVDHCHTSGRTRALLCNDCNLALGHVRDDPTVLQSLINYLEEHRAE